LHHSFESNVDEADVQLLHVSRRLSEIWDDSQAFSPDASHVPVGNSEENEQPDLVPCHLANIWNDTADVAASSVDGMPIASVEVPCQLSEIWKGSTMAVDDQPFGSGTGRTSDIWKECRNVRVSSDVAQGVGVEAPCRLTHVWSANEFCTCEMGEFVPSQLAKIWNDQREPADGAIAVNMGDDLEFHQLSRIWSQADLVQRADDEKPLSCDGEDVSMGIELCGESRKLKDVNCKDVKLDLSKNSSWQPSAVNILGIETSSGVAADVAGEKSAMKNDESSDCSFVSGVEDSSTTEQHQQRNSPDQSVRFICGLGGSLLGSDHRIWSLEGTPPDGGSSTRPATENGNSAAVACNPLKAIWDKPIGGSDLSASSSSHCCFGESLSLGGDFEQTDMALTVGPDEKLPGTVDIGTVRTLVKQQSIGSDTDVDLMLNLVSGILEMMSQTCAVSAANSAGGGKQLDSETFITELDLSNSSAAVHGSCQTGFLRRGSLEASVLVESSGDIVRGCQSDAVAESLPFPQCFSAEWPMTYSKGHHTMPVGRTLSMAAGGSCGNVLAPLSAGGHWSRAGQHDCSGLLSSLNYEPLLVSSSDMQAHGSLGSVLCAFMSPALSGTGSDVGDVSILTMAPAVTRGPSTMQVHGAGAPLSPVIVPRHLESMHMTRTKTQPINLWS
jgi:hypothetical protein